MNQPELVFSDHQHSQTLVKRANIFAEASPPSTPQTAAILGHAHRHRHRLAALAGKAESVQSPITMHTSGCPRDDHPGCRRPRFACLVVEASTGLDHAGTCMPPTRPPAGGQSWLLSQPGARHIPAGTSGPAAYDCATALHRTAIATLCCHHHPTSRIWIYTMSSSERIAPWKGRFPVRLACTGKTVRTEYNPWKKGGDTPRSDAHAPSPASARDYHRPSALEYMRQSKISTRPWPLCMRRIVSNHSSHFSGTTVEPGGT